MPINGIFPNVVSIKSSEGLFINMKKSVTTLWKLGFIAVNQSVNRKCPIPIEGKHSMLKFNKIVVRYHFHTLLMCS
jgi:hypothetical protein